MFRRIVVPFAFASSALLVSACDETEAPTPGPFSPLGTESELYGEWDVNALVPTADICARAEIDTIEVLFSNADDSETFTDASLRWPCGPGYYDSPRPMLRAGTFGYRWRAYHGEAMVLESRKYNATVVAGEELELMPVDFVHRVNVRVDASLSWATGVGQGTCAEALVDTMSWELRRESATGPIVAASNGTVACAGTLTIPDLPLGILEPASHVLIVHGAASDSATWDATCALTVFESGPSAVTCAVATSTP